MFCVIRTILEAVYGIVKSWKNRPPLSKHGVLLVSDEIHQDLALFGHRHTSFNTVDPSFKDFSLILTSATKTFNIAGTKIPMWSLKIQSFVRLLNNGNWPIINMKFQAWAILQQKRLIAMVNLG